MSTHKFYAKMFQIMKFHKRYFKYCRSLHSGVTFLLLLLLLFQEQQQKQSTVSATRISLHSQNTQIVQHFRAPRPPHQPEYFANGTTTTKLHHKELIFTALLPGKVSDNKNDCILPKVLPALELAIEHVQQLGFPNALIDITLISRDTFCSSTYGPIGFFEICSNWSHIEAIFGLPCEYVLAPITRYAGIWEIPVITSGGNANAFDKKAESYPTLTRMKGAQVNNLGNAVLSIIERFNWTRTALLFQHEDVQVRGNSLCYFCINVLHEKLDHKSVVQQGFGKEVMVYEKTAKLLNNLSKQVRIVIMCAEPQTIRHIMLTAEELNMIDSGEYVFINIELFSRVPHITSEPWYDKNDTAKNNERARKAYTAMLTVTPKQPDDDEYIRVSNKIKTIAANKYNYTFQENELLSSFVTSFYDGVLLYANALNDSIREDPSVLTRPINGTDMVRRMWNRSFTGITGNVTIDANGDRLSAYSLLDMNPDTGHFETVANFLHNRLELVPGKEIHWAGNRKDPPPDRPLCGFDGSLCPDNSLPGYAILSIVLGILVIVLLVCFFFGYRHYKAEAEINSMAWKVSVDDVIFHDAFGRYFRGSFSSLHKCNSQLTVASDDMGSFNVNGDRQIFIPVGVFRGCKIAVKFIDERNVSLTRSLMLELKKIKDLTHDHLVKFYGACLDPAKSFLLTEYCPKGSLQDILENDQFQLDWMFKLSLMHDIVRGMQFLHSSDIKSHGNLKSSNCVVDSRFVLKITDFGLHSLRRARPRKGSVVEKSHSYWNKLLWTAPELLKIGDNRPPEGTQKGDVYSFGIIVHEITARQGPFYLGPDEPEKSPAEIVELVMGYPTLTLEPFRPHIINQGKYDDINAVMTKCWSEDPTERPDFNTLKSTIRKFNKDNETGNIVDNLLKRMEMYANNLEELVEERTQDYLEEKKKCEKLLYQLLPQSVAAQLISGQPVVAETFDQVTIYFSDIVGFTAISAESTPMQVVQFLNDLYTCFDSIVENYDVYKVETIGDAYMVVSGLPIRNDNYHAREIARLALALLEAVHNFKIHHRPMDRLKLRIGLHTGACVAGVVGLKMPRYCLFGDTVNTASRMESNGEALKIHISETTKKALDEFGTFITTKRGYVPMKGKGEMLTYWLEGEMPKVDLLAMPSKLLLSRRSSLKQHPQYQNTNQLNRTHWDFSALPPPYQMLHEEHLPLNEAVRGFVSNHSSPTLRVKRKISSSSPKLNGIEFKTDGFDFQLPMDVRPSIAFEEQPSSQPQQQCVPKLNPRSKDLERCNTNNSIRSLREPQKDSTTELAHFRLPLSGALKTHNNNYAKGSFPQSLHSNSNSNLNGILQPNVGGGGVKPCLKTSATATSSLATSTHPTNHSGFNGGTPAIDAGSAVIEIDEAETETEDDHFMHHPLNNHLNHSESKINLLENSKINNLNKSCNSAKGNNNNFNNIVKVNNVKNVKIRCNSTSNSLSDAGTDIDNSLAGAATAGKRNVSGVTQPLLTKVNT